MPPHRFLAPAARGAKSEISRTPGKIQAGKNPPAREETAFPAALIYHKSSSFDSVSASSFSISCFWVLSDNSSCLITCTSRVERYVARRRARHARHISRGAALASFGACVSHASHEEKNRQKKWTVDCARGVEMLYIHARAGDARFMAARAAAVDHLGVD